LHKMIQSSVGLLFLGQVILRVTSLETCEAILPSNTTARIGESAVLQCRLNSQNIGWTFCPRNGRPRQIAVNCNLVPSAIQSYRLEKTSNSCNLKIDNVTLSHLGTYTCQDLTLNDYGYSAELGNLNENLALRKNAISSTYIKVYDTATGEANYAVDGNTDGNYNHGSCAYIRPTSPATWWAVDLEQETSISRVRVSSRTDCCINELQNFFVGLTNRPPWSTAPKLNNESSICAYYPSSIAPGVPIDIVCLPNTLPGRYLFILMNRSDQLTLCEVEAFYK